MTELHLFRKQGDVLVPVILTLDEHRVIQGEREAVTPLPSVPANAQQAELTRRGVKFTQEGGTIMITKVPEAEQQIMKFFSPSTLCWFPECEEMRRQYQEERQALRTKNPACRPCEEGAVTRKYIQRVRQLNAKTS